MVSMLRLAQVLSVKLWRGGDVGLMSVALFVVEVVMRANESPMPYSQSRMYRRRALIILWSAEEDVTYNMPVMVSW